MIEPDHSPGLLAYDFSENASPIKLGWRFAERFYLVMIVAALVVVALDLPWEILCLGAVAPVVLASLAGHSYAKAKGAVMPRSQRMRWGFYTSIFVNAAPLCWILQSDFVDDFVMLLLVIGLMLVSFVVVWGQVYNFVRYGSRSWLRHRELEELEKSGSLSLSQRLLLDAKRGGRWTTERWRRYR